MLTLYSSSYYFLVLELHYSECTDCGTAKLCNATPMKILTFFFVKLEPELSIMQFQEIFRLQQKLLQSFIVKQKRTV